MKLRNKKTGEIGNFCYGHTSELCVAWQKDDGFWEKQEYNSLAELNEEWEDYEEPKEYYAIDLQGDIIRWARHSWDEKTTNKIKEIGNYFETKEEAEKAVEKLLAWKRLKDKGFRFIEGWLDNNDDFIVKAKLGTVGLIDQPDVHLLFGDEE